MLAARQARTTYTTYRCPASRNMAQVQQGTYITTPALSVIVNHLEIVAVPTPAGARLLIVTVPVPLAVQELAELSLSV